MDEPSMPNSSAGAPQTTPPTGPPTPPIPLAELLAREELGLRRIAGPADADLLWVHTSEMADPYPYLLGGELLLSAGVLLTDPDHYVGRLVQAGAAALGFGVRPVHETVPAALIEACDRQGLPLLEVPPETPFTTIARAVWRLMAEARHRELRRVTRAQQALATAAARPDPVPAVLHQLATQLGGRAALLTARGQELHAAGRRPDPEAAGALTRLARVVARERPGSPSSATDTHGGTHLSAYALGGGEGLVLALATRQRESGDHTVAGIAVVLLSLLAAPHQGADAAGRSAALVRMLLGASPAEVAPLLGSTGPWTVIHARRTDGAPADALTAGALGASLGTALVDAERGAGEAVRVLLGPGPEPDRISARPGETAAQARPTAQPGETTPDPARPTAQGVERAPEPARPTPRTGWTLGASAPTPVTALAAADAVAARALAHARATRAPLTVDAPTGGLAALVPPEQAAAHARALLAPLTAPLADTLRCWLSLHGSWDRTAVALGVHRNTVRQRIGRCGELLAMDLDDMDVRTELWFALRQT
ncbi:MULTISPECIES: PucR family transcriptional regulator [Streptomyces]|uniref:PucR family transcriptional regulator n=1 Tax=Streptomyces TaxID=1883 RepID=UPI000BFC5820|nr:MULTISPECIES: PucR family transcriptional regulator [Streptomyces]MBT1103300.1 PucR family transcriptional regulator ligand-binding domain-containing protein [Streptomyces sp. Tu10]WUC89203.1 PucR family transcriptional regulator [Streptomyces anulatus]